jgi:hypothetical protein
MVKMVFVNLLSMVIMVILVIMALMVFMVIRTEKISTGKYELKNLKIAYSNQKMFANCVLKQK